MVHRRGWLHRQYYHHHHVFVPPVLPQQRRWSEPGSPQNRLLYRRFAKSSSEQQQHQSGAGGSSIGISLPVPWLENSNWRWPLILPHRQLARNHTEIWGHGHPRASSSSSSGNSADEHHHPTQNRDTNNNHNHYPDSDDDDHRPYESPAQQNWTWKQLVDHKVVSNNPGYDNVHAPPNLLKIEDAQLDPYVKGVALGVIETTQAVVTTLVATTTASASSWSQTESVVGNPFETGSVSDSLQGVMSSSGDATGLFTMNGMTVAPTSVAYAFVILLVTFLLITTSLLTIAVILSTEGLRDVTGYFIISLAISDLLSGTLITPFSLYAALDPTWRFGSELDDPQNDDYRTSDARSTSSGNGENGDGKKRPSSAPDWSDNQLCRIEAYLEVMIWTSIVYIFMWMCVDRYTALERQSRYEVEMSATRVKCWIAFSWISAVLLACPILAAQMKAVYYEQAFICQLDWTATTYSFSWTMAALVLLPTTAAVVYVYRHIFTAMRNPADLEDTQNMLLDSDPNFMVTFFVILAFFLSWLPFFMLKAGGSMLEAGRNAGAGAADGAAGSVVGQSPTQNLNALHFSLAWLAMSAGCWKFIICMILHTEFRAGFHSFCHILCCGCCCGHRQHAPVGTTTPQQQQQHQQQYQQQQQQRWTLSDAQQQHNQHHGGFTSDQLLMDNHYPMVSANAYQTVPQQPPTLRPY